MKSNKNDSRALFRQALSEAFVRKYDRAMGECTEAVDYCRRCERNVRREISGCYFRRRCPVVVAAAVLVAMLVTCGCSWSGHRERMGDYLIEHTAEAVKVFTAHRVKYDLSDYRSYQLGYVPDGYELTYEFEAQGTTHYSWKNSEGNIIRFEQTVFSQLGDFNNKGDEIYFIDHNGTEILYVEVCDEYNAYIHCRGKSHVVIASHERFSDEVIGQMIDSITER